MHTKKSSAFFFGVLTLALTGLFPLLYGLLPSGQARGLTVAVADHASAQGTPTPEAVIVHSKPLTTPTATETEMETATPSTTPTGYLSVTVDVLSAATLVPYGAPLTVTVTLRDESVGCSYSVFEMTLRQEGDDAPIFRHDSPDLLQAPGHTGLYTLTAIAPGVITFSAETYGEIYCGFWQWHYLYGASGPVTVTTPEGFGLLPLIFAAEEQR